MLEGWAVFESTDAVLTLAAAATLLLVVTAPPHVGRALVVVGAIATGVVAVALVDKPNFFGLPYVPGLSTKMGAWLALLEALLILTAGALEFREPTSGGRVERGREARTSCRRGRCACAVSRSGAGDRAPAAGAAARQARAREVQRLGS